MSLLQEIQESVIQEGTEVASVLLKLRLLSSRLGSATLEEWVKFESEGYPSDAHIPNYRNIPVTYRGSFAGPFGASVTNASIPPHIIEKNAGKHWTNYKLRQSIASIDDMAKSSSKKTEALHINAANLILLIQGKMYPDYSCYEIRGIVSPTSLVEVQHVVKSRVLELTIQLEKSIPAAKDVTFGKRQSNISETSAKVSQLSQQIIFGNYTSISSSGEGAQFQINFEKGDNEAFKKCLIDAGIDQSDATDLAEIIASEEPGDKNEPLGLKAKKWVVKNLMKAIDGTWKVGISVVTEVIKKAALKFYGLG